MKKTFAFLLAALLLLSATGCGLGGKTLYLPETVQIYNNGEQGKTLTYQYNEEGFLTAIVTVSGESTGTASITCDTNGNVLSSYQEQLPEASLLFGLAHAYTYSTRGNLLSVTQTINGQLVNQTNWEYNSKDQVTSAVYKDGSTVEYHYEYGEDGKLLAIDGFRDGKQVSTTAFAYDEKGRMALETLYNDRETEVSRVEYRYEDGKTIAALHQTVNGLVMIYIFDHAGNIVEIRYGEDGDSVRYVYTYKEVKVSGNSPRRSYTGLQTLPATGLTTLWQ